MLRARIKNSIRSFQKVGGTPPFSFGNALEFDGVDDFVSFSSIDLSSDFTISFWSYLIDVSTISICYSGTNDFFLYHLNSGALIRVYDGNVYRNFGAGISLLNQWVHFVVIGNGSNLSVYYNNISLGTQTRGTGSRLISRFQGYDNITTFNGNQIIDEVAVWNTSLTASDVAGLYNSGGGDYATNYSPVNLIAYWRMNESGTDTTAVDEQGTYNGTLNNFPASGMWVAH